ncbi:MAG: hypothetical protein ABIG64_09250 [Candidatus Omnitrophota bacterium]
MQANMINYLQIFFRRKHLFLYPFLFTVFVAVVLSFVLPKTYVSSSAILIEEENVLNPLISGLAISSSVADRHRIIREQILSWKSLTELTRRLKLDEKIKTQFSYEELIKDLRDHIVVELRGPQLVTISYNGRIPKDVQLVAKELTDIFIHQNVEAQTKETDVAVNFLQDQLKLYRRKIKEDEIKNLEGELENLLVDSTVKHPLVKNLKARIAKLKEDFQKDDIDIKIKPTKASLNKDVISYLIMKELQKDSQAPESPDQAEDISLTERIEGLPLDSTVNEEIYSMLLERLETAKITKQLETFKEGTRFTIIDPPRLPLKPVKPDPVKFLLYGIGLGACVGYGCILLAEMVDRSYKNITDTKVELERPLLGVISAIITEDEFYRRKNGAKFTYTVMAAFFALMVIIVLIFSIVR